MSCPIEFLLVGLAGCLTAGVASVAQNRGIQLRSVEATVEGNHDIRGILGADSDVRNGFNDIKVTFTIDASGVWDQRYDEIDDLTRARRLPSPQLAGTPGPATLDLSALTELGVELVGRWAAVRDGRALFSGGLRNVSALADLKMERLLGTFDEWAKASGRDAEVDPPERFPPATVPASPRLQLDLSGGEIRTVVWATGFRPDYEWLDVPVIDGKGQLIHEGGVLASPGLYALGLPVLRRRRSTFICGIEDDAREVIGHLTRYLARRLRRGRGAALVHSVVTARYHPETPALFTHRRR